MKRLSILMLFTGALLAVSCARTEAPAPEEIPSLVKQEFHIVPGTSRSAVEELLGPPTELGATKEGYTLAQYRFGYSVRSVVYDRGDRVVQAYPPSWNEPGASQ